MDFIEKDQERTQEEREHIADEMRRLADEIEDEDIRFTDAPILTYTISNELVDGGLTLDMEFEDSNGRIKTLEYY